MNEHSALFLSTYSYLEEAQRHNSLLLHWSNCESKILKHPKFVVQFLTRHLPSDMKFTCWRSCKPRNVFISRYKDILWKEVHHGNQCRMSFYHTVQLCTINSLEDNAVCKKRHKTYVCRIFHTHFISTATLNTNELDMIFQPTPFPVIHLPGASASNISPEAVSHLTIWHLTNTSIFQYSIWLLVT